MTNVFEVAGKVSLFGLKAVLDWFRRPFEGSQIVRQLSGVGARSDLSTLLVSLVVCRGADTTAGLGRGG